MDNSFLSQDEIDALLNGDGSSEEQASPECELTDLEKDLLGEVGNISMGTAATALSAVVGNPVNITTPTISISTLEQIKKGFSIPNIVLDVQFVAGISGGNLLVINLNDAAVIANLMMGGDGKVEAPEALTELEISAVSEAMNQMIGSAATSMATMFNRKVDISPPVSSVCDESTEKISADISEEEEVVSVTFRMTIGDLVDSNIVQVLPIETAKKIVSIMMGTEEGESGMEEQTPAQPAAQPAPAPAAQPAPQQEYAAPQPQYAAPQPQYAAPAQPVDVKQAAFQQLQPTQMAALPNNIDLILDVPLEISVELGRTKKNIKEVLDLTKGSLIELNKLAEEPVDIFVNGKRIAYGEVVVVDENFGVKITEVVSSEERVRSLSK